MEKQLSLEQIESESLERDSGFWQRVKQLGFVAIRRNSDGTKKEKNRENFRTIADEVPEFLDLGPQRYGDPSFWVPETDGPLLEDKYYQRALKAVCKMELPSETIDRWHRQQRAG